MCCVMGFFEDIEDLTPEVQIEDQMVIADLYCLLFVEVIFFCLWNDCLNLFSTAYTANNMFVEIALHKVNMLPCYFFHI